MRPPLPEDHVLQRGQVREEVVGLEDEPEAAADPDRVDRRVGDHLAVEEDVAVVDLLQQVDAAQQGRLARAGGADQRHRFVFADGEVDAAQDLALAKGLGDAAHLEHGAPAPLIAPPPRARRAVDEPRHRHRHREVEQRRAAAERLRRPAEGRRPDLDPGAALEAFREAQIIGRRPSTSRR